MYQTLLFLIAQLFFITIEGTISKNYYDYIQKNYGDAVAQQIARKDFGVKGSFGGGNHRAGAKTK